MNQNSKLVKLRELMVKNNIDLYLITDSDKHSSEYVNEYYKERSYMSNFKGSNGLLMVSLTSAYLWTDGRYFLEAQEALKNTTIELMKMGEKDVPTPTEFINKNFSNKNVGLNGDLFSYGFISSFDKTSNVIYNLDLVSEVWDDKDSLKVNRIYSLDYSLVGENVSSKLKRIREFLKEKNVDSNILGDLCDIAWTFNLRGSDIDITPVFLSFAYISLKKAIIFLNTELLDEEARLSLNKNKVEIRSYHEYNDFLLSLKNEKISVSYGSMNYSSIKTLSKNNTLVIEDNPSYLFKAVKNKVEIKNNNEIHISDGLSIFRLQKYVKENFMKVKMDELSISDKVLEYRKMSDKFNGVSFDTISAFNENGAIVHYEPTKETNKPIDKEGFLLVDSGGQYKGGTTDITRTYSLGEISDKMKHHYTMVLKANINVSMCKFRSDISGRNIDMLAKNVMHKEGLDYNHGTGHGIGYMLNVHEGPNGIRYKSVIERKDGSIFKPGMIQSIEPGLYFENEYGIRIENEILVQEDESNSYGDFYRFKTITCAPIDLDPVVKKDLTKEELKWLNDYHKWVYKKLSKLVREDELDYLKYACRKI